MAEKTKIITVREVTVRVPVIKAPGWLQGFVDFIREQGVIGLAVAFILGIAAKGVIDSVVNDVVNPVIGLMYGSGGQLVDKQWCLRSLDGVCTNPVGYGAFFNQLVNFFIVAAVIYFVIKGLKLGKLDKPKK